MKLIVNLFFSLVLLLGMGASVNAQNVSEEYLAAFSKIMEMAGQAHKNINKMYNDELTQLDHNQNSMTHQKYQKERRRIKEAWNEAIRKNTEAYANMVETLNGGNESAAMTVPIPALPDITVPSVSGTYIPPVTRSSSIEETQSSSIGYQPSSGSNKKQGGSYNTISEGVDSQTSYRNNDEAKRLEDQRKRDEWNAQEKKSRQDRENREIENRAFQLEGEIRSSRHSSSPNYRGMATEASSLSQDSRRAGNSGAAFYFDNAESKLNQMSRDVNSISPKSTSWQQDMDNNRKNAAGSVWQGGSSIKH